MLHDCVLYIIFLRSMAIVIGDDGDLTGFDANQFKCLYVGITNNPVRRGKEHSRKEKKRAVGKKNRKRQPKLNAHIYANGWKAYEMTVLKMGMTHEEACALEIETIAKYRTFEFGLNSTPGGDCGPIMSGADHYRAQAINLYNNKTGEISSFTWLGATAAFLEYDTNEGGRRISAVANPNVVNAQIQSKKTDEWYQARHVYDETPFVKDMPTPVEKRTEARRKKILVFNMTTLEETSFDGTDLAAVSLSVGETNIKNVLCGNSTHFNVPRGKYAGMYDTQRDPRTREWKMNVLTRAETLEKAVIAYNEEDEFVFRYDSAKKAMEAEGINASHVYKCAKHKLESAGKKNGSKLSWEYEDSERRAFYDLHFPRKPKKPYYYIENDAKVKFKTLTEAIDKTRGTVSINTQYNAITNSVQSKGNTSCRAGHIWFKL